MKFTQDRHPSSTRFRTCSAYVRGLLAPVERKNSWMLAERVGEGGPVSVAKLMGGLKRSALKPPQASLMVS